jgi:predicted glycosyltransferase
MRVLFYPGGVTGLGNTVRLLRVAQMLCASSRKMRAAIICPSKVHHHLCQSAGVTAVVVDELAPLTEWRGAVHLDASTQRLLAARASRALVEFVNQWAPELVVTSRLGGLTGELYDVLPTFARVRARIVVGWRDILDTAENSMTEPDRLTDLFEEFVRRVVVFATPDNRGSVPAHILPARLGGNMRFLGYIPPVEQRTHSFRVSADNTSIRRLMCHVGGGVDGAPVTELFKASVRDLQNRWHTPDIHSWIVHGLLSRTHFSSSASENQREMRWIQLSRSVYQSISAQVVRSGYNTCVEAAYFNVPTVLVPRWRPGDTEQMRRASIFCEKFTNFRMVCGDAATSPREIADHLRDLLTIAPTFNWQSRHPKFFAAPADIAAELLDH